MWVIIIEPVVNEMTYIEYKQREKVTEMYESGPVLRQKSSGGKLHQATFQRFLVVTCNFNKKNNMTVMNMWSTNNRLLNNL